MPDDAVPVLPCTLTDLRLVFCAHLSSHDYPPVTPQQAPGHTTHSWIQWLTPEQLEAVAATEGPAYTLLTASDPGRWLALDHVQSPPRRFAVWWHHAALDLGEGVVVFAGNPAAGLPADPDGLSETVLLHRLVALWMRREGKSLAWDGCSLPPERREGFRRFLYAHARPNPPPSDWTEWDHSAPAWPGPSSRISTGCSLSRFPVHRPQAGRMLRSSLKTPAKVRSPLPLSGRSGPPLGGTRTGRKPWGAGARRDG